MFPSSTYPDLFDRLRMAGFEDGPGQRYKAHLLIAELTGRLPDEQPKAAATLADHLRPLFQRREDTGPMFDAAFKAWAEDSWDAHLADLPTAPVKPLGGTGGGEPEEGGEGPGKTVSWWQRLGLNQFWVWARALIAIGVIGGIAYLITNGGGDAPLPTDQAGSSSTPTGQIERPVGELDNREQFDPNINRGQLDFESDVAEQATIIAGKMFAEVLRRDGAPTVRELHEGGMYLGAAPEDVAAELGLPLDHPVAPTMAHLYKHLMAVYRLSRPQEYSDFIEFIDDEIDLSFDPNDNEIDNILVELPDSFEDEWGTVAEINSWTDIGTTPAQFERALEIKSAMFEIVADWGAPTTLEGHEGEVYSVAFSPDGAKIANGSSDRSVRVWDAETGAELLKLEGHEGWVLSAAFSPDGQRLVSGSNDSSVRVWDAETGAELLKLEGHEDTVWSIAFSPDGQRLVSGSNDSSVRVWDAETGAELLKLEGHESVVYSAAFSPDGQRLVSGARDDTVRVWDAETGAELLKLEGHEGTVNTAAFSPDGQQLVSGSGDYSVRVWDAETGAELLKLEGHEGPVWSAAFSPDGAKIVSGAGDYRLKLWNAETGELLHTMMGHEGSVRSVAFSPDGAQIVSGSLDNSIKIWSANEGVEPAIDAMREAPWTIEDLGSHVKDLADAAGVDFPENVTDTELARQFAALAFHEGYTVHLIDPPWDVALPTYTPPNFAANLGWWVAGALALAGIFGWIISALNLKSYLRRRRPDAPGRVIDLFSERRKAHDPVQEDVREAARAMMTRTAGRKTIDIHKTIRATARAGGLFTAVETHAQRLPEYLFLIDSHSRADHEARRALDYVSRLNEENVRVSHAFFEQAPDRVREKIGDAGKPLEDYAAENSDKILVIVGDAANMLEPGRLELGAWKEALGVWKSRILLSTVPAKEWGVEEESVAKEGLNVRPLSASGLAGVPETLQTSEFGSADVDTEGALAIPPLPRMIRRDPERWVFEDIPDDDDMAALEAALAIYLEKDGWRWLCACTVYPVIEWDLTVELGRALETASGAPIFSEGLAARLAELPWMREGHMPGWLRERLIATISDKDREAVRGLIAEILDAVENERKSGGASISLSFAHTNGRAPDADERFVDFVTRAPEKRDKDALSATRQLRRLLRPSYLKRLTDIGALSWIVTGGLAAIAALLVLPDLSARPASTHAWTPLVLLALLTGGALLAVRGLSRAARTNIKSWWTFNPALARDITLGRGRKLSWNSWRSDPVYSGSDVRQALSRRVSIWLQALLIWSAVALFAVFSVFSSDNLERLVPANWADPESGNWLSVLRDSALGELGLTITVLVLLGLCLAVLVLLMRWLQSATDSVAAAAVYTNDYLEGPRRGWLRNVLHLSAALFVSGLVVVFIPLPESVADYSNLFFAVLALFILAWHWRTARAYSAHAPGEEKIFENFPQTELAPEQVMAQKVAL